MDTSTSNPLAMLPKRARTLLYFAYGCAGLVVGVLTVADVAVGKAPDVLAYLAVPFSALAGSNVVIKRPTELQTPRPAPPDPAP